MNNTHEIYLISDSTGETLDRIFLALKAQFNNIQYKVHQYSFTRTENQISKIIDISKKKKNSIIFKVWFSVLVNEYWWDLYSKFENWACKAKNILSRVSPVESETR